MQNRTVPAAAEGLPTFSRTDDRARFAAELVALVEQMDDDACFALVLHLKGLETGVDKTLEIHALVGDDGRGLILDWERKFGPSYARKGGLL